MKIKAWCEMISYWEFNAPHCDKEIELPSDLVKEYEAVLARFIELNEQITKAYEAK